MKGGSYSAQYIFVANIISRIIVFTTGIALSRILAVEDFGYLLILNIIFGFVSLFSISGYEYYYIQYKAENEEADRALLRTVFRLRIIQTCLLVLLIFGIAGIFYFRSDELMAKLLAISGLIFPIMLLAKPEEAQLTKQLNFKTLSIARIFSDIAGGGIKVASALLGLGPLAFSIGNVGANLVRSIFIKLKENSKIYRKSKGDSTYKTVAVGEIRRFGWHLFLNTGGAFLLKKTDRLLVASFFPKAAGGLYEFGQRYAALPFDSLIAPQTQMVLSLLSKHQHNKEYLLGLFRNYGWLLGIFVLPMLLYFFVVADDVILFVFGEKWMDAVPVFRIFLVYYVFRMLLYPGNAILTSHGRPDIKSKITIGGGIFTGILLLSLSYLGQADITMYAAVLCSMLISIDLLTIYRGFQLLDASFLAFVFYRFRFLFQLYPLAASLFLFTIILPFSTGSLAFILMTGCFALLYTIGLALADFDKVKPALLMINSHPKTIALLDRILVVSGKFKRQ